MAALTPRSALVGALDAMHERGELPVMECVVTNRIAILCPVCRAEERYRVIEGRPFEPVASITLLEAVGDAWTVECEAGCDPHDIVTALFPVEVEA
jgi:hypothetical protein